jgi:2-phosphosulfolactate phosphatase
MSRAVHVYFLPVEPDESELVGRCAVVVDLLRASTTIAYALQHGAREVIPLAAPEEAMALRESIGRDDVLLCGERRGERIAGFDLGNSPAEYTPETVGGKTLLFASSNGSGAMLVARAARRMAVAGLVNTGAAVEWICRDQADCAIICAGKLGQFAADDTACAGLIVDRLIRRGYAPANDAARLALQLSKQAAQDWLAFLNATDHGRYLAELGFGSDLATATEIDALAVLPIWKDGRITINDIRSED